MLKVHQRAESYFEFKPSNKNAIFKLIAENIPLMNAHCLISSKNVNNGSRFNKSVNERVYILKREKYTVRQSSTYFFIVYVLNSCIRM